MAQQTSHQTIASRNSILTSPDQRVTRGIQVNTIIKYHHTRRELILTKLIKEKIGVQSVVIQSIQKVSSVLPGSSSARPTINMVILQACAARRKSRTPKALQLQVGVVHMQEDSVCSQSSDLNSSNES